MTFWKHPIEARSRRTFPGEAGDRREAWPFARRWQHSPVFLPGGVEVEGDPAIPWKSRSRKASPPPAAFLATFLAILAPAHVASGEAVAAPGPWDLPAEGSCSATTKLRGWPLGEDAPPFTLTPGDAIDAARSERLRGYLPPPIWEQRERFLFEGMRLEIGPCFRDYGPPAVFTAATEAHRGRAKLLANGGLADHIAGLPFPPDSIAPDAPDAGQRFAWNVESRWRAAGFRGRFRVTDLVGRIGRAEPFEGEIFQREVARRADRAADGYRVPDTGTWLWVGGGKFLLPQPAREFAWLQYRDVASEVEPDRSDDLHTYVPAMRKVRRYPAQGIEGLFVPSFSVGVTAAETLNTGSSVGVEGGSALGAGAAAGVPTSLEPKRSGFEGLEQRPLLHEYRLLGVQDVLAPINAAAPAFPAQPDRDFGPYGLSFASDRWDLRRAIVLEGQRRQAVSGAGEVAARLVLWVDLQTLQPLYYASYDERGEPIDVGQYAGRFSEDRSDYPGGPGIRVIDSAGAAFANLRLRGSWRRESWDLVSGPEADADVRRALSLRSLTKGR